MIYLTDGDLNDGYGSEVAIFDVKIIINEGWMPGEYKEEGDGYNWGKTEYTADETWDTAFWDFIRFHRYIKVGDYYYITDYNGGISSVYSDPHEEDPNSPFRKDEISYAMPGNVPFYNLDKHWTVEITYKDYNALNGQYGAEHKISGTYSLASYYVAMKARWDGASSTEYPGPGPYQEYTMCAISDFVYSVYACSQSLAAYRFNEMVPEPGN